MNITLVGIFLEGVLSFLSPCVLPLLPLYMSYLAGEDKTIDEDGNVKYKTIKVFITTIFFVLGISLTFVLLTASLDYISTFIDDYSTIISIIGGTLLIIFGLHEIDVINIDILNRELKPKLNTDLKKMNFLKAFGLGFVFSLGWSPCIGPMLSNAILLAATNSEGYLYIVAYALGLIIPFLLTGLLTSFVLNFINRNKRVFKWVLKIAGIIIICFGCYMIYDASEKIIDYKNSNGTMDITSYLLNYEFKDQYGNTIKLSDYKNDYVMVDFIATWCSPCQNEIPLYHEFANENKCKCLYIMSPGNNDVDMNEALKFIEEYNITIPVILDENGILKYYLGVSAFPTKYIIHDGKEFVAVVHGAFGMLEGYEEFLDYAKDIIEDRK